MPSANHGFGTELQLIRLYEGTRVLCGNHSSPHRGQARSQREHLVAASGRSEAEAWIVHGKEVDGVSECASHKQYNASRRNGVSGNQRSRVASGWGARGDRASIETGSTLSEHERRIRRIAMYCSRLLLLCVPAVV